MEIDDLLARADSLLSFKTKPSAKKAEVKKSWSPYGIGSLGPKIELHSLLWNWNEEVLKSTVVHLYEPTVESVRAVLSLEATICLHSHPVGQHCPWGLQCHVFPCTSAGSRWGFNETWDYLYRKLEEIGG